MNFYKSKYFGLGVKLYSKLSFNEHINYIRNKDSTKLKFLKRTCHNFRD